MKKIIAVVMVLAMLFGCVACTSGKKHATDETYEIMANFSKLDDRGNIVVMVQDLGGVYEELYSQDGLVLKFIGSDDEIYDDKGNKMDVDKFNCGDSVKITYDGKLAKNNPKTIKVYKVTLIEAIGG